VALERTIRARQDLDWLPPSFKAIRWSVAGTIWTGVASLVAAAAAFAKPTFFIYGKAIALLFAGGYYAGDRAARAVLRGRLSRLATGRLDLRALQNESDGELVHVRGRIRSGAPIQPLLGAAVEGAVYRRVVFVVGGERWVHEAAEDFHLVDGTGETALVDVSDARLIAPDPKRHNVLGETQRALLRLSAGLPAQAARPGLKLGERPGHVSAGEIVLRNGDEVEVVGYKGRTVDQSVASRLERDTPMRASLRGGRLLPLLISPMRR
jgi:hypothetical protein